MNSIPDNLRTLTVADIMTLSPCYDPVKRKELPADWTGTVIDILKNEKTSLINRLWAVGKLVDDRISRLFAVKCARSALSKIDSPDPRSVAACDVAERYANGEATSVELEESRKAAYSAYICVDAHAAAHAAAYTDPADAAYVARKTEREKQIGFYLGLLQPTATGGWYE